MIEAQPRKRVLTPRAALLVVLVAGLMFSSLYPINRYFALRASTRELQAEEAALDARIRALRAEGSRLRTDEEIELIARRELGMVRPGEVPFVIVVPDAAPAAPAVARDDYDTGSPAPERPSLFERWWRVARAAASPLG